MGPFRNKVLLFSAFLVFLAGTQLVFADDVEVDDEGDDDEVTVEPVEEDTTYSSPQIGKSDSIYLAEHFDDINAFKKKWVKSQAKKQGVDENIAKYDGEWEIQSPSRRILKDDLGLVLTTEAKHAAISALLNKPFEFRDKPLVVQYEVTMQQGQNCGGAYIKLLSKGTSSVNDLKKFHDQTPYTIMFGPDKCGNDNKLHFIFRHKNPKNGTIEEKHSKKPSQRLDDIYKDKEPHLYQLEVKPDNTFSIKIDGKEVNSGSLLEDFTPAVNPPEEIEDPEDKKPDEWDEREKIVDPSASKPEDWDEDAPAQIVDSAAVKPDGWLDDEPDMIPDPEAKKPDDWDVEMDGEWEPPLVDNPACVAAPGCGKWTPPMIPNPAYKGKWRAPLITNPNYKGKWTPRMIRNPDYFRDTQPFKMTPIHAVGFELWSMSPALLFDNLIVTDDPLIAEVWAQQTFALKKAKLKKDSDSFVDRATQYAAENPWVYAVGIIVVFVFVGFFAYLCCASSPKDQEEPAEFDPKKTDAVTEDDPHQSEGEGDEEEEDKEEEDKEEEVKEDQKEEREVTGKSSLEEQHTEEQTRSAETDGAGDGQRKRKPRKE